MAHNEHKRVTQSQPGDFPSDSTSAAQMCHSGAAGSHLFCSLTAECDELSNQTYDELNPPHPALAHPHPHPHPGGQFGATEQ